MARSSRRSARSNKSKSVVYSIGDIVQFSLGKTSHKGRLVAKLASDGSPPSWTVALQKHHDTDSVESWTDTTEVSERSLGRVLGNVPISASSNKRKKSTRKAGRNVKARRRNQDATVTGHVEYDSDTAAAVTKSSILRPKNHRSSSRNSPVTAMAEVSLEEHSEKSEKLKDHRSESSDLSGQEGTKPVRASALAREQRSQRRQALLDQMRAQQESNGSAGNNRRGRPASRSKGGPSSRSSDEHVVKIEMKTGILYLYRGPTSRRAEFVRLK